MKTILYSIVPCDNEEDVFVKGNFGRQTVLEYFLDHCEEDNKYVVSASDRT